MKQLFIGIALCLAVSAIAIRASFPDVASDVPVLYWVTDRNPARPAQVNGFHRWLLTNGHCTEARLESAGDVAALLDGIAPTLLDDILAVQPHLSPLLVEEDPDLSLLPVVVRVPMCEVRVDTANRDNVKQTIQSVSGVGSDVMDVIMGRDLRMFQAMGVLEDVTEDAEPLGFGLAQTYASVEPELTVDGRQYGFPCNVSSDFLWVNTALFHDLGMDPPPRRWTLQEFERIGIAFCERANAGRERREVFFLDRMPFEIVARSLGASLFNETMTVCVLDDQRYAQMLDLSRRWMYELNILPTPDDEDAFSTAQGFKGAKLQLFGAGNYAMVLGGRYFLLEFRKFEAKDAFTAVEPPHGGFPNTNVESRIATVYRGSKHPELAKLFLAYLASESYNAMIVRDGDALPPNPAFATGRAYLEPPDFPHEWGVHGPAADAAVTLAVANEYSPFVLPSVVDREMAFVRDEFLIGRLTSQEVAKRTAAVINREIEREVRRKPDLRPAYEAGLALQGHIDARKQAGQPIPANWVVNPFLQRYYRHLGALGPDEPRPRSTPALTSDAHAIAGTP